MHIKTEGGRRGRSRFEFHQRKLNLKADAHKQLKYLEVCLQ